MSRFEFDRDREYTQGPLFLITKPDGFWISVVGICDWAAKSPYPEWLEYSYDVRLSATANLIRITTLAELEVFHAEYSRSSSLDIVFNRFGDPDPGIDWERVVERCDGIICAPFLGFTKHSWYNIWDCASGCIWNLSAIESVTPIREKSKRK